ncbi:MAG: hypothetical protein Q4C64_05745 [Erysipelotrichia bacterium]|nr:hypothetical protein [Erysipelotrichia bacterium]
MKYLITGHGNYPIYTLKTVKFLLGERSDILTVCAHPDNNNYRQEISSIIQQYQEEGLVIFTDILSGSVNQYCMQKLEKNNFHLITGYNIAMLLEMLLQEELSDEIIRSIVDGAKQQLIYCNELLNL